MRPHNASLNYQEVVDVVYLACTKDHQKIGDCLEVFFQMNLKMQASQYNY